MSSVVVARKVAEIRARVARVRELMPRTVEEFVARRTEAEALIFNLYLALQGVSDLAIHVVVDRSLGVPGDARAAFELLERANLVDPTLAQRLASAVGLRNRIAHEYGRLDLQRVFEATRDGLGDLDALAGRVAKIYQLTEDA